MSVISTVISRWCTAHASDSLIVELQPEGTRQPVEWGKPKFVKVEKWWGAISYWGLALARSDTFNWSTLEWLKGQAEASHQFASAEEFALGIAANLNHELGQMRFNEPPDYGIGMHFTAYERIQGYWVPELFLISNWTDPSYCAVRVQGVGVSRETYHTISNGSPKPEHREDHYRLCVHAYLQDGGLFIYNNGFPEFFNAASRGLLIMFQEIARRGQLVNPEGANTYMAIARRPIETVSKVLSDFSREGTRTVGGKPHDLAITPGDKYWSTSGDA